MGRIREKLNSQSGVSFLLALLAFLVAAMVSVTIVAAAVTTVKRVNSDRESQQAQLTLISAAQLVRDEMEETKYIVTTVSSTLPQPGDGITEETEGTFGQEMQDAVVAVNRLSNLDEPYKDTFEIGVPNVPAVAEFEMAPVDVSFIMKAGDEQYRVIFTLLIEGSGDRLFLAMDGKKTETTSTKYFEENVGTVEEPVMVTVKTTTVVETYTWDEKGIISGIGDTNESKT